MLLRSLFGNQCFEYKILILGDKLAQSLSFFRFIIVLKAKSNVTMFQDPSLLHLLDLTNIKLQFEDLKYGQTCLHISYHEPSESLRRATQSFNPLRELVCVGHDL